MVIPIPTRPHNSAEQEVHMASRDAVRSWELESEEEISCRHEYERTSHSVSAQPTTTTLLGGHATRQRRRVRAGCTWVASVDRTCHAQPTPRAASNAAFPPTFWCHDALSFNAFYFHAQHTLTTFHDAFSHTSATPQSAAYASLALALHAQSGVSVCSCREEVHLLAFVGVEVHRG